MFRPSANAAVYAAAAMSGASCLIAELVWSRYLHLIFGVSAYALAMLTACFMLGLALGSWYAGRIVDRTRVGPRVLLIAIEAAVGGYVLLSPVLFHSVGKLSAWVLQRSADGAFLEQLTRVTVSGVVLIVPTFLMGATVPLFVKLLTPDAAWTGRATAIYYASNTLGAAAGAFATGFLLMPALGLRGSLLVGAGCSAMAALLVWWHRTEQVLEPVSPIKQPLGRTSKRTPTANAPAASARLVVLVFAISGFVGMAYEVGFARLLTFFFRDSVYDFTIVLTAFLCGAALGSALASLLVRRARASLVRHLAVVQILAGFCALASLLVANGFPYWLNDLQTNTRLLSDYGNAYWTAGTLLRFGYTFLLLLIPSTLCGATFPIVAAIIVEELPALGRRVGLLAGVNALGSAAGALAAGFLLANLLGVRAAIIVPALVSVAGGALLLQRVSNRVAIIVAALVLAAVPGWDRRRMSASFLDPRQPLEQLLRLPFYREDAYGITSVVEVVPLARKYLVTNRLYAQNSSEMNGLEDHRRLGHIPMLLHPDPQSVLAVGLGAGITLRGIDEVGARYIDCVEIAPAVVEAARLFEAENGGVLERPNVQIMRRDARGFLAGTTRRYDVIVLDIFHPMSAGSSTVFSREYYELCRQRLSPGGLACQWLPTHQLTTAQVRTIVATFRSVFPHVSVWYGMIGGSGVVGCVGGEQPMAIDLARLTRRYEDSTLVAALSEVNLGRPELLLSHFVAADSDVDAFVAGAQSDTDDRPVIEFSAPKNAMQSEQLAAANLHQFAELTGRTPLPVSGTFDGRTLQPYLKAKRAVIGSLVAAAAGDWRQRDRILRDALADDPDNEDLRDATRRGR